MCGRYYVEAEDQTEELQKIIDEIQRGTGTAVKTGEVCPTDLAPVVANNRNGEPTPFAMPREHTNRKRAVRKKWDHRQLLLLQTCSGEKCRIGEQ